MKSVLVTNSEVQASMSAATSRSASVGIRHELEEGLL